MKRLFFLLSVLITISVAAQSNIELEKKVADRVNEIAEEVDLSSRVSHNGGSDLNAIDDVHERKRSNDKIKEMSKTKSISINKMRQRTSIDTKVVVGAPRSTVVYPFHSSKTQLQTSPNKTIIERDKARTDVAIKSANENRATAQKAYENAQKTIEQAQKYEPQKIQNYIPVEGNVIIGDINSKPSEVIGLDIPLFAGIDKLDKPSNVDEKTVEIDESLTEYDLLMQEYYEMFCADENCLSLDQLKELEKYIYSLQDD